MTEADTAIWGVRLLKNQRVSRLKSEIKNQSKKKFTPNSVSQDTVAINFQYFQKRTKELDLKQSWIAMELGVSPRTVLRWYNGQVLRIKTNHFEKLLNVLDCQPSDLSADDDNTSKNSARNYLLNCEDLFKLPSTDAGNVIHNLASLLIEPNASAEDTLRIKIKKAEGLRVSGNHKDSLILLNEIEEDILSMNNSELRRIFLLEKIKNFYFEKKYNETLPLIDECFELCADQSEAYFDVLDYQMTTYGYLANFQEIVDTVSNKIDDCTDPKNRICLLYTLANAYLRQGNFKKAKEFLEPLQYLLSENHFRYYYWATKVLEIELDLKTGEINEAHRKLNDIEPSIKMYFPNFKDFERVAKEVNSKIN